MSDQLTSFPTISGGLPTSIDLGPSIAFTILYSIIFPLAVWRAWMYRRPASLIFTNVHVMLFAGAREVTFGIRAAEAHAASQGQLEPDLNLFVVEQILLSIGFIVLVVQLVSLVKGHLARTDVPPPDARHVDPGARKSRYSLQNVSRLMEGALLGAIALGILAGTQYSNAINDPSSSAASKVKTYRTASGVISLVVAALCVLISAVLYANDPRLPRRSSAYLFITSCILVIVPAYRVSSITTSSSSYASLTSTSTKVEFWVLQATMEFLTLALLLAVDTRIWFGMGGEKARVAMGKAGNAPVGMGRMNRYQTPGPNTSANTYGQA